MRFEPPRAVSLALLLCGALGATTLLARVSAGTTERFARAVSPPGGSVPGPIFVAPQRALEHHEFYFTRAIYSSGGRGFYGGWGRGGSWAIDYPKADRQFMVVLKRLIDIDAYDRENAVSLADSNIRRFPFLYALEVGRMSLTEAEVEGLRSYLEAGGFLVIDDFWGPRQWANFERQISRVLPGRPIYELPRDHPLFNNVYDVTEIIQVPSVDNGRAHGLYGTPTHEGYGSEVPHVLGIDDDRGELIVVINWNTDLGDAWEWAEHPYYPLKFSTYAFEMGVNMIAYAMSH